MKKNETHTAPQKKSYEGKAEKLLATWRAYAILIALGMITFGSTAGFGYVYFDDNRLILDSFSVIESFAKIPAAFQTPYFLIYYRPLVTLSLIIDAQISGLMPWMYHISNILLHLIASSAVFLVLTELRYSRPASFFAAALFAVLPIATNAVAWILGRNDTMLAIFLLFSLWSLLRFESRKSDFYFILHGFFFLAAVLTKEAAVVFPVLCFYYVFFIRRVPVLSMKMAKYVISWGSIGIVWYILRNNVLAGAYNPISPIASLANIRVPFEMLGKMVIPIHLSTYPTFNTVSLVTGVAVAAVLVTIALTNKSVKNHTGIFALLWLVLLIAPSLAVYLTDSVHRFKYLECRAYTAGFGLSLFIAALLHDWMKKSPSRGSRIMIPVIVLFTVITIFNSMNYKNAVSHWKNAVETSPNAAASYYNLAVVYTNVEKNIPLALANYKQAADMDYTNAKYWLEYGALCLNGAQNTQKAIECYTRAIEIDPQNAKSHHYLGLAYLSIGKAEQAIDCYVKAVGLDSTNYEYYDNLGIAYGQLGQNNLSEEQFLKASRLKPDLPYPLTNLAFLYLQMKEYEKAEEVLQRAFLLDSTFAKTSELFTLLYRRTDSVEKMLYYGEKYRGLGEKFDPQTTKLLDSLKNR